MHANGWIRVFDKSGVPGALDLSVWDFWCCDVPSPGGYNYQQVRFDRLSGRWILLATSGGADDNTLSFAISSGPTITDATEFSFQGFSLGYDSLALATCVDPSLGIDAHALYVGCRIFNAHGQYLHSSVYVIRKAELIGGSELVVTRFLNITNGPAAGPITPRGVDNDDPEATEGYFIGVDPVNQDRLVLRRVSNPGGIPVLSGNLEVTVPATALPLLQPASGSTTPLDVADDRLFAASIHRNKLTGLSNLRTAQHIAVTNACAGASIGSGRRNGARWYEIGSLTSVPTLVQSGTLCDTAATNARGYIYPTVAASGQGHMVLAASFAAPNQFAGIAAAGRLRTDPPGSLQPVSVLQSGIAPYNRLACSGSICPGNLWGDYSSTSLDPVDDMTIWTVQEYADANNNWAVRVIQMMAPPPATPVSVAPAGLCVGSTATPVLVSGASLFGSEFFDPGTDPGGPGYPNHLAASTSNGLIVRSVSSVDPTHVTLVVDASSALPGSADVTITNPDGQSATGPGILHLETMPAGVGDSLLLGVDGGTAALTWDDAPGTYNVYRGVVVDGVPWSYNQACFVANSPEATATDATLPALGSAFFYLVSGVNSCGESAPGHASDGAPNPNPAPCS